MTACKGWNAIELLAKSEASVCAKGERSSVYSPPEPAGCSASAFRPKPVFMSIGKKDCYVTAFGHLEHLQSER